MVQQKLQKYLYLLYPWPVYAQQSQKIEEKWRNITCYFSWSSLRAGEKKGKLVNTIINSIATIAYMKTLSFLQVWSTKSCANTQSAISHRLSTKSTLWNSFVTANFLTHVHSINLGHISPKLWQFDLAM